MEILSDVVFGVYPCLFKACNHVKYYHITHCLFLQVYAVGFIWPITVNTLSHKPLNLSKFSLNIQMFLTWLGVVKRLNITVERILWSSTYFVLLGLLVFLSLPVDSFLFKMYQILSWWFCYISDWFICLFVCFTSPMIGPLYFHPHLFGPHWDLNKYAGSTFGIKSRSFICLNCHEIQSD